MGSLTGRNGFRRCGMALFQGIQSGSLRRSIRVPVTFYAFLEKLLETDGVLGSEEEKGDVLQAYIDGEGSVRYIIEHIMVCSYEDEPRFLALINEAISSDTVEKFPKWTKETSEKAIKARKRAAEKEAKEAEELSKEIGLKKSAAKMSEGELGALIQQRAQSRMNGLLEKLEAQATAGKRGKRTEPTEDDFMAIQARMDGRKKSKKQK
jgi:DnaJ homolog subfamily C member 9